MTLPPYWKVKREVTRIRNQMSRVAADFYEPPLRILHKRWLETKARPLTGKLPVGPKVAILVVYQPKGIARSLFLTADHLIQQGYSPFILCNMPLMDDDRTALLARAALLLERPNFGYDFGAYQDGIRLLEKLGCKPDRLILMNDSTWFPLRANDTSIARMEASGDAFTGQVEKIEPDLRHRKRIDHIESHLLMFTKTAIEGRDFREFWKNYSASSNRENTIKRGEKRLSAAMFNAGFRSEGLLSRKKFLSGLTTLSYDDLCTVISETCDVRGDVTNKITQLIQQAQNTPEWRNEVMRGLEELVFTHNFLLSTAFVFASMKFLDLGFVKKGKEEIVHLTQQKVLGLAADGKIAQLDPSVLLEIEQAVAQWTRQT